MPFVAMPIMVNMWKCLSMDEVGINDISLLTERKVPFDQLDDDVLQ